MRLATRDDGSRDGALVVVSTDGSRCLPAGLSMQAALDDWTHVEPALRALAGRVDAEGETLNGATLLAPLPRAWQWLDGSAFPTHGALMQKAFKLPPIETDKPLMYQGMSHRFLSATQDVSLPSEADGIDFEGEFAVVTGDVPMGCGPEEALGHVRLVLLLNDWSLRAIAPVEMKTGFGWVQAKPACSVAPFAITPEALGDDWRDGRVCLPLTVEVNGAWFGNPVGDEMAYGFHELIAHAARTRDLPAGTIIGSGTVSNVEHQRVGSTCLSERRAIEMIEGGAPLTPFLSFGDRVTMRAGPLFGSIDQRVVSA
ncbi:fumarylacetoacetate (FAA) hydrolase family protein [Sphingomonas sp. S17]|uniref:Fumarylacetoacetate hydrolase family protein n=2 Tax=Sphingomonas paucimobilis TaxID=13689 RepID=A0A7T3E5L4_SPHPI|nr:MULTISPECIES: fumarylacetoacetate hydrolase family protein [Sphingomonas]EGI55420.1 fumarylacetoacetate (FAA) hydrolase family protein [Sphingomonas sp. S17]MCM3680930.1 fumarylacetoacetate hydrolase family protein [Sphingomonas paucimobilis]MDG5971358.1 fumarylacetoacetate hydrolase family protein [Sphingomonas paucimobilis]QPS15932.1 fumarylacetoacetate hydrolase family protein [Sphingomonas paucimobilis]QPT07386.1 fumarylacetoacetate hydrolase family protein [Sphingomonas paucimobilis]